MKKARTADGWRRLENPDNYKSRLSHVAFHEVAGFERGFSIELHSGLTSICGRNGVGKSSFLKILYFALKKEKIDGFERVQGQYTVAVTTRRRDAIEVREFSSTSTEPIFLNTYYIEPSKECHKILGFLRSITNVTELLDGIESSNVFRKTGNKDTVEKIIGKSYSDIEVYEIEGAMGDDTTFPYFKVVLPCGLSYSNKEMGMGELICLYLFWYINWIPDESIILLDEIDSFISAYSQKYLTDFLAYSSSSRSLSIVMSTHSETIISEVGLKNTYVLRSPIGATTKLVQSKHERAYLTALGISPRRKGAFLVEDTCARFFLKSLIKIKRPDMFEDYMFFGLRCDPNLEKITKHFEPHAKFDYEMHIVFDADQMNKIAQLNSLPHLYVTALPSHEPEPPEVLLWDVLLNNLQELCSRLGLQFDYVEEKIGAHQQSDLHDRFPDLARDIDVNLEALIHCITVIWCSLNEQLVDKFLVALELKGDYVPYSEIENALRPINFDLTTIVPEVDRDEQLQLTFNGLGLEVSKKGA